MRKRLLIVLFVLIFSPIKAQERLVSITVDDLPGTSDTEEEYEYIMSRLTTFFSQHKIPAIGFVNEYKLYNDSLVSQPRIALLEKWVENDLELGNHTYSHISINQSSLEDYERDILKGERIIRSILNENNKQLKYFRYTQLRTGPTEDYRLGLNKFLKAQSYITAPVTIDNDEYIYAFCYARSNEELKVQIGKDYLRYMRRIIVHYEKLSLDFVGYEIPQILLIHANELNADYIEELMELFTNRGYQFVHLDKVLSDEVYSMPEGTHRRGPSWINRWMTKAGKTPLPQPEVSAFISELYRKIHFN